MVHVEAKKRKYRNRFIWVSHVMTREILMDRVWGTSYEGESRTLDMHIKTLRKKLGEDGGKLIKTVRNVGYKFQS